jgi:hypothetical protein
MWSYLYSKKVDSHARRPVRHSLGEVGSLGEGWLTVGSAQLPDNLIFCCVQGLSFGNSTSYYVLLFYPNHPLFSTTIIIFFF